MNKITIKFGTKLKPTKYIAVNYNFTIVYVALMLFLLFLFFSSLAVGVGLCEYIHLKNYIPSRVGRSMFSPMPHWLKEISWFCKRAMMNKRIFYWVVKWWKERGKLGSNFVKFSLFCENYWSSKNLGNLILSEKKKNDVFNQKKVRKKFHKNSKKMYTVWRWENWVLI